MTENIVINSSINNTIKYEKTNGSRSGSNDGNLGLTRQHTSSILPGQVYLIPMTNSIDANDDDDNFCLQFHDKPELLAVRVEFSKFVPDKETQILVDTESLESGLVPLVIEPTEKGSSIA